MLQLSAFIHRGGNDTAFRADVDGRCDTIDCGRSVSVVRRGDHGLAAAAALAVALAAVCMACNCWV